MLMCKKSILFNQQQYKLLSVVNVIMNNWGEEDKIKSMEKTLESKCKYYLLQEISVS